MIISFDLDGTLIPFDNEFETEKRSFFARLFGIEDLRKGTKELFLDLNKENHTIYIYTTSYRTKLKIRSTFKYYGISVHRIINQNENEKVLRSKNINATKCPPAFGINIHIDDLEGVKIEGEKFDFKTIIINKNEKNWIDSVKSEIKKSSL